MSASGRPPHGARLIYRRKDKLLIQQHHFWWRDHSSSLWEAPNLPVSALFFLTWSMWFGQVSRLSRATPRLRKVSTQWTGSPKMWTGERGDGISLPTLAKVSQFSYRRWWWSSILSANAQVRLDIYPCCEPTGTTLVVARLTAMTCIAQPPITGPPVKRSRSTKGEAFRFHKYCFKGVNIRSSKRSEWSVVSKEWVFSNSKQSYLPASL
jgi:hypothetical protein